MADDDLDSPPQATSAADGQRPATEEEERAQILSVPRPDDGHGDLPNTLSGMAATSPRQHVLLNQAGIAALGEFLMQSTKAYERKDEELSRDQEDRRQLQQRLVEAEVRAAVTETSRDAT
jgi:hypothetical protein